MNFLILLFFSSCNTSLQECKCDMVEIYGMPMPGALTPIRITPESMLEMEPIIIKEKVQIEVLITELLSLEKHEFKGSVDNRFLLELHCEGSKNIIVESNSGLTQINGINYQATDSFVKLINRFVQKEE